MHSIPQSSFIGTQQQGYLTLLTLLFRPMLIVAGFFVGFAFFEIAVDFIAYTFFAVHATIQGQTAGGIGFLELVTLMAEMVVVRISSLISFCFLSMLWSNTRAF